MAAKVVDLREAVEDLVLVANEETEAALKVKLLQGTRGVLEMTARLDGPPAQAVAGSGQGRARLLPMDVQSGAHLRGAGGGGSHAVGEISQGERSQQDEGSGRFVLCV